MPLALSHEHAALLASAHCVQLPVELSGDVGPPQTEPVLQHPEQEKGQKFQIDRKLVL